MVIILQLKLSYWNKYSKQVKKCKEDLCVKSSDGYYKTDEEVTACKVGCALQGPYVSSCSTTLTDETIWKKQIKQMLRYIVVL